MTTNQPSKNKRSFNWLSTALYQGESTKLMTLFLIGLYLAGLLVWIYFFRFGNLRLFVLDWLENHMYYDLIHQALVRGQIPYQIDSRILIAGGAMDTRYFLGNMNVGLTPDIFLLRWVSAGVYALIHFLLFYGLGVWGFALLQKRFKFSPLPAALFFMLFNFNGYLTAHLGIGHTWWVGYLALPLFAELVFRWLQFAETDTFDLKTALYMSLLLYVLYLNGSLHPANWLVMFLGLLALTRKGILRYSVVSVGGAFLLAAHRFAPTIYALDQAERSVFGGYPSFQVFLNALTKILRPDNAPYGVPGWGSLWWWEYDIYVGYAGLLVLLLGVVYFFLKRPNNPIKKTSLALLAMFVLSFGIVYGQVFKFVPLASIERVPSRFIAIPLFFCLLSATLYLDELLQKYQHKAGVPLAVVALLVFYELAQHTLAWRVAFIEKIYVEKPGYADYIDVIPQLTIVKNTDFLYQDIVIYSLLFSLLALSLICYLIWWQRSENTEL